MFIEAYAYCEYGKEPKVFKSITKGTIANKKSGKYGWSWDYILYQTDMKFQWEISRMKKDLQCGIMMD